MRAVFLGNMNNFPFGIAKELKKRGYETKLYLDTHKDYILDRPESTDLLLKDNYPKWIIQLGSRYLGFKRAVFLLLPNIFYRKLIAEINSYDIVFLNGEWFRIGKYISPNKFVIGLFAGYDLEIADQNLVNKFAENSRSKNRFTKKIPLLFYRTIWKRSIQMQIEGVKRVNLVNYYLPEINPIGDEILQKIKNNLKYSRLFLRGFDTSLFDYNEPEIAKEKFIILSVTRFFFTTKRVDNKRNDIMIKGIALFVEKNNITKDLEIIFFEKGDDLEIAKKMCVDLKIAKFIKWIPIIPLYDLKPYFAKCDVAFDQLGEQWVGAGLFSMLAGRPLIANGRTDLYKKYLGEDIPVCQALNEEEVCAWLTKLYTNRNLIKEIGLKSRNFILKYYNMGNEINFYKKEFESFQRNEKLN